MVVDDQRFGRKEPNMIIIRVDHHPSDQYIAFVDTETGS
jgi:nanoRNase/pAp phosphatase (c-di-AMP/oligoRNAs hydrolase)